MMIRITEKKCFNHTAPDCFESDYVRFWRAISLERCIVSRCSHQQGFRFLRKCKAINRTSHRSVAIINQMNRMSFRAQCKSQSTNNEEKKQTSFLPEFPKMMPNTPNKLSESFNTRNTMLGGKGIDASSCFSVPKQKNTSDLYRKRVDSN